MKIAQMHKPDRVNGDRTLAGRAYRRLRQDVVSGHLAPGSKLRLEKLVGDYEIGMSPLREALARLVGDGLVVSEGQRGFWVAPLSLDELEDVSRVRAIIETEALNLAIRNGGEPWEADVRNAFNALTEIETQFPDDAEALPTEIVEAWERCNRDFHAALVSACGSPWLMRLRDILYQQSERYRRVSLDVSRARRSVHDEHVAIAEAVLARNALRACRMIELHLSRTADEVRHAILALREDAPDADRTSAA
jgi:DNA-binding GntR family transcriptional regulator